jgi:hypothetical protein
MNSYHMSCVPKMKYYIIINHKIINETFDQLIKKISLKLVLQVMKCCNN